jgi:DNA-binding MarR family transcriptional regulator
MNTTKSWAPSRSTSSATIARLAAFRYQLRRFLRFSEKAARARGLTPQQHQLLLGVAGYTGRGWATVSELAEFLQARHNAVVGLVERAERRRLVRKERAGGDRRFVRVYATSQGQNMLDELARLHREELGRVQARMLTVLKGRPRTIKARDGSMKPASLVTANDR